jgi:hypothetical protein
VTRIRLLSTWFGEFPRWLPATLTSCGWNKTIDWIFLIDRPPPPCPFPNIKFERFSLTELNQRASKLLGMRVAKGTYSQVDLKPFYGLLFPDHFAGYDFWGHVDLDVIWGDIRAFVTEEILAAHDIISARKGVTAGHFNLYRNQPAVNQVALDIPMLRRYLESPDCHAIDEPILSAHLRTLRAPTVYWKQQLVVGRHELRAAPTGWAWRRGQLLRNSIVSEMYMHFIEWKFMSTCEVEYSGQRDAFYVNRCGIYLERTAPPVVDRLRVAWRRARHVRRWVSSRVARLR